MFSIISDLKNTFGLISNTSFLINLISRVRNFFRGNDLNNLKNKLKGKAVEKRYLYDISCRWYVASDFTKVVIIGAALVLPFLIGALFSSIPFTLGLLGFSALSLIFIKYESNIIELESKLEDKSQINDIENPKEKKSFSDIQQDFTNWQAVKDPDDIFNFSEHRSCNMEELSHQEKRESDDNKGDLTLKSERSDKKPESSSFQLILKKARGTTRTETVLDASTLLRNELGKNKTEESELRQKTSDFIKRMKLIAANDPTKNSDSNTTKTEMVSEKGNNLSDFFLGDLVLSNTSSQIFKTKSSSPKNINFNTVLYVNSLDNFKAYCIANLDKLVSLFKRLNVEGLKIVCKIEKNNSVSNKVNMQNLTDSLYCEDEQSLVEIQNEVSKDQSNWVIKFDVVSKNSLSNTITESELQRKKTGCMKLESITDKDDSSVCYLTFFSDKPNQGSEFSIEASNNPIHLGIETEKTNFGSTHMLLKVIGGESSLSQSLPQLSQLLGAALENLEDDHVEVESQEERESRLSRDEREYQRLIGSMDIIKPISNTEEQPIHLGPERKCDTTSRPLKTASSILTSKLNHISQLLDYVLEDSDDDIDVESKEDRESRLSRDEREYQNFLGQHRVGNVPQQ